ncbi:hypothetical protein [Gracilibacillus alcaliphilus]|nr:hypothetical protein [Gracilibacillus alcaliphilus]MBM7677592.1 hypothetical protein [Gracilibacillus alcaliphilus]
MYHTVPAAEVTSEEDMHGIEVEGIDMAIDSDGESTAELEPGE